VREETPVTPDTALRLSRTWGTTPNFWLGLQAQLDLETAQDAMTADIAAIVPRKVA
jgi:addiction module HigA family antidote